MMSICMFFEESDLGNLMFNKICKVEKREITFQLFNLKTFQQNHTASDNEVKVNSLIFIGGIRQLWFDSTLSVRSVRPKVSKLFSMITGLSLKRKFLIGN